MANFKLNRKTIIFLIVVAIALSTLIEQTKAYKNENNVAGSEFSRKRTWDCSKDKDDDKMNTDPKCKSSCKSEELVYKCKCRPFQCPYNFEDFETFELPESFDLRKEKGDTCPSLNYINDQGNCDSCWAVAATDVMTDRLCLLTNGEIKRRFSPQDPLGCCPYCRYSFAKSHSCDSGGMQALAWAYWVNCGIVSGHYSNETSGCLNYKIPKCFKKIPSSIDAQPTENEIEDDSLSMNESKQCIHDYLECPSIPQENHVKCTKSCECDTSYSMSYKEDKKVGKGKICYKLTRQFDGDERAIRAEIYKNGPVHATMTMYKSFYKFMYPEGNKGDVYLGPTKKNEQNCGRHSIRILGWEMRNKTNYWIVANSWGTEWGNMGGFFYLHFDHDKDVAGNGNEIVYAGIPIITEAEKMKPFHSEL